MTNAERKPHLQLVHDSDDAARARVSAAGQARPSLQLRAQLLEWAPGGAWSGTQGQLATELSVSRKTIDRWEDVLENAGLLRVRHHCGQASTDTVLGHAEEADCTCANFLNTCGLTSDITSDIVSEVSGSE